jgi:hypothetical protein
MILLSLCMTLVERNPARVWYKYTYPGLVLVVSLGPWICLSHQSNEWFYNQVADSLFCRIAGGGHYYCRSNVSRRSWSQQCFHFPGPAPSIPDLEGYVPVGVERVSGGEVILGSAGPLRYDPPPIQHDLFSLLQSWGGEWIWESIQVEGSVDTVLEAHLCRPIVFTQSVYVR